MQLSQSSIASATPPAPGTQLKGIKCTGKESTVQQGDIGTVHLSEQVQPEQISLFSLWVEGSNSVAGHTSAAMAQASGRSHHLFSVMADNMELLYVFLPNTSKHRNLLAEELYDTWVHFPDPSASLQHTFSLSSSARALEKVQQYVLPVLISLRRVLNSLYLLPSTAFKPPCHRSGLTICPSLFIVSLHIKVSLSGGVEGACGYLS